MITTPVLYGNRLFGFPAYSENSVAETLLATLGDTLLSSDADIMSAEKVLADTQVLGDVAIVVSAEKVLGDTLTMADAKSLSAAIILMDSSTISDSTVRITTEKGLTEFVRMQEWLAIKLLKADPWTSQGTANVRPSAIHIYGNILYGHDYYSSNPTVIWIKPGDPATGGWQNFDGENNQGL